MRWMMLLALLGCDEAVPTDTDADTESEGPVDFDKDGYTDDVDCDDNDFEVNPDADEYCNGIDNDCDGLIDEDAVNAKEYFTDADKDGFGEDGDGTKSCEQPPGTAEQDGDCNDNNADINPGADEVCDELNVDENCNGDADDDDIYVLEESLSLFYVDDDGDGYGDPDNTVMSCDAADGRVLDNTDCDDKDPKANPDLGCGGDWDGTWEGEVTFELSIPDLRVNDRCSTSLEIAVHRGSKGEIWTPSSGTCVIKGLESKYEVFLNARFDGDDGMSGTFTLGPSSIPMKGAFSGKPGTLAATGKESFAFEKYKATGTYSLKAVRVK